MVLLTHLSLYLKISVFDRTLDHVGPTASVLLVSVDNALFERAGLAKECAWSQDNDHVQ